MECIDCIQAGGKDFERLDENNCCPQCEKTVCPYCEDHMYDAKKKECANIVMKIAVKYALVI